ncbi:hypothetical protein AJ79_09569 [Helicocarpus griseus UAMH5409]|uniref:SUN domain-containing protein n=1 Tax=Helicocarpus griseus UAMH5409 TaxID=1447875 RepID=A0A2B7WIW6_9EURO|nr:hypothetical protein AJ79_09569 [Helicocarpus griseus UAMH5409]
MAWSHSLLSRRANSKYRATDCLSCFLVLAALAAVRAGENANFKNRNVSSRALDTICPTANFSDIQLEYIRHPVCIETRWMGPAKAEQFASRTSSGAAADASMAITSDGSPSPSATITATVSVSTGLDQELDTESPLDNANFLSFEEWKKQNLAKVGQSAENVGGNRPGDGSRGRQRPVGIDNSLDSLGEDAEIELEFGGFAPENSGPASWERKVGRDEVPANERGGPVTRGAEGETQIDATTRGGVSRRKDAGTTCKERFNYASFDCAATVLKTNPQCTGASSVLIENKDSYMLNECRAKDKFLILELCDDILIDTVVLANYEFFSSIFRTFKVSVSDRYPPKQPDMWKELGTYEAVNSREVQAFAVENPLIWARYVKIEFLSHYGNEFYCPVSLIRIHGTTMLEEYKNDGEASRPDEDVAQIQDSGVTEPVPDNSTVDEQNKVVDQQGEKPTTTDELNVEPTRVQKSEDVCVPEETNIEAIFLRNVLNEKDDICPIPDAPRAQNASADAAQPDSVNSPGPGKATDHATLTTPSVDVSSDTAPTPIATPTETDARTQKPTQEPRNETSSSALKAEQESSTEPPKTSTTVQQPPPNPTTQESFFKSVNKRLHMLETNSSLSLQYIEEQSRILRDAFNKVEKRQLAKTSTFLENLNTTVLHELREFRQQYDHVWKSVAIEFEQQRLQYHQEVFAVSTQLGILADELLFQKRISIIQSVFVLICFGLVLFSRTSVGSYLELTRVHSMVSRSQSFRSSSPSFETPSASPGSRPNSSYRDKDVPSVGHRRTNSEESRESNDDELAVNPTIAYSPPTPTSDSEEQGPHPDRSELSTSASSSVVLTPEPPPYNRSESSPPDLRGPDEGTAADEGKVLETPRAS